MKALIDKVDCFIFDCDGEHRHTARCTCTHVWLENVQASTARLHRRQQDGTHPHSTAPGRGRSVFGSSTVRWGCRLISAVGESAARQLGTRGFP